LIFNIYIYIIDLYYENEDVKMFFRKKKKQEERPKTFIIEEMVTDNNGLPVLNFDDHVEAFNKAQKIIQSRKKVQKKPGSDYTRHFFDDEKK